METTGALKPDEIVILALKVLERKLDVAKGELDILEREQAETFAPAA